LSFENLEIFGSTNLAEVSIFLSVAVLETCLKLDSLVFVLEFLGVRNSSFEELVLELLAVDKNE